MNFGTAWIFFPIELVFVIVLTNKKCLKSKPPPLKNKNPTLIILDLRLPNSQTAVLQLYGIFYTTVSESFINTVIHSYIHLTF